MPVGRAENWNPETRTYDSPMPVAGLPVSGYKPTQSAKNIEIVNKNKHLEELCLRQIDNLKARGSDFDQRSIALAMTGIQEAFMWLNRGVFQPQRVKLDTDL